PALEDDHTFVTPTPPSVVPDDTDISRFIATQFLQPDDPDSYYQPTPIVVINTAIDDLEAQFKPHEQSLSIIEDAETQAALPPVPPTVDQGRFGLAEEDITVGDVMDFGFATAPPFAEDEPYKPGVISLGPVQLDDPDSYYPPTPIVVVTTATDDVEGQFKWSGWSAPALEEDLSSATPTPPFAVSQDSEEAKWIAWLTPALEDDWVARAPTPPVIEEISIEEASEKWIGWSALQPETIEQNFVPPTPPSTVDQDTEQSKWLGWIAPALEDDWQTFPPRPPVIEEVSIEEVTEKWVGWSALQPEELELDTLPPTPPLAIQDEVSERFTDTRQIFHDDTDTQSAVAPIPPLSVQESEDLQKWLAWASPVVEDDQSY